MSPGALLLLLVVQQPPPPTTPAQRAQLAARGWPPAPPTVRPRDDVLFRRNDGLAITGSLTSLHAFASVTTSHGNVNVGRDQISMILVNGALIPTGAPALPLDSDAVVMKDGTKVVGRVEIDGNVVRVGARPLQQSAIALIRLRDPKAGQGAQATEAGGSGGTGGQTGGGGRTPTGQGANPGASGGAGAAGRGPARPRGPAEIPWGQALWRGVLRFEQVSSNLGESETGMYYATIAESALGKPPYLPGVNFRVVSLVYQYQLNEPKIGSCAAFTFVKNGSGFDGTVPEIHSGGIMSLPMPGMSAANTNAGGYHINLFSPVYVASEQFPKVCTTGGPATSPFPDGNPLPSFSFGQTSVQIGVVCTPAEEDVVAWRAKPPFSTIAGEVTCGTPGEYRYTHLKCNSIAVYRRSIPR